MDPIHHHRHQLPLKTLSADPAEARRLEAIAKAVGRTKIKDQAQAEARTQTRSKIKIRARDSIRLGHQDLQRRWIIRVQARMEIK